MQLPKLSVAALAAAAILCAQPSANTAAESVRRDYRSVRDLVIRSAEKMPGEKYGYRPTPEVRTFARQIAHIADDQYNLCAGARSETRKESYTHIEDTFSSKDDLIRELKKGFAYCDAAYDALSDVNGAEPPASGKRPTRFGMLNWNLWHTWEHYGNIVVYLRINGIVPPSSEPR